jgi:hypothetical protein
MIRTYLKKRNKPDVLEAVIQEAVRAVQERLSLRAAASRYGMAHTALNYRITKISNGDECNRPNVFTSRYASRQIFNDKQELTLMECVLKCLKLNYVVT